MKNAIVTGASNGIGLEISKKLNKKILLIKNLKDKSVDNKVKVKEYTNNISCILFTSGTTGPPKGVMVSDKMLITSAYATGLACDVKANDRFLLWESLHHIGGLEILIISLLKKTQLFLVKKFSARNFWKQVRKYKISKFHYLGGILDILVKQPSQKTDHKHNIKLGFGAGARKNTIKIFNKRFKIPLREVYGMTEASSFTTINFDRINNSIGKVLPWFKIKLINKSKNVGEIFIKEISKNVISKGYYGDKKSTIKAFKNNGFYTGDLWDRPPCLRGWSDGRVALLGDSCHATMPNIGQGSGLAFEDAFVLSNLLGELKHPHDIDGALNKYYAKRLWRSATIQGLGRMNSEAIKILTPLLPIKPVIEFVISPFLPLVFFAQFGYCYSFCPEKEEAVTSISSAARMNNRHIEECMESWHH